MLRGHSASWVLDWTRSHNPIYMRRTLAFLLVILALSTGQAIAQVSDDTLVPQGRLRLQFNPSFTAWDSRFGERAGRAHIGEGGAGFGSHRRLWSLSLPCSR